MTCEGVMLMSFKKLLKVFKNPKLIFFYLHPKGYFDIIPDKIFLRILFFMRMDEKLNLKKPESFSEKIQWLKLYDRKEEYTDLADKYRVREYIKSKIGDKYLVPLLGVWECMEEINFVELPNKFVLKTNHGSGGVVICKDKTELDFNCTMQTLEKSFKRNYFFVSREYPYKNIKPLILAEKFLEDKKGDLKDYKVMCFNGEPKCLLVCTERETDLKLTFFDLNWNEMPFSRKNTPKSEIMIEKPKAYEEMIRI